MGYCICYDCGCRCVRDTDDDGVCRCREWDCLCSCTIPMWVPIDDEQEPEV